MRQSCAPSEPTPMLAVTNRHTARMAGRSRCHLGVAGRRCLTPHAWRADRFAQIVQRRDPRELAGLRGWEPFSLTKGSKLDSRAETKYSRSPL